MRFEEQITGNKTFDLQAMNHGRLDIPNFRVLLKKVERPTPEFDKPFSKIASRQFKRWFGDPSGPLPESAYALLSNWFLTANKVARESSRGIAAKKFWKTLFCNTPGTRLTDPKEDSKILLPRFDFWWIKQEKLQSQGQ